MLKEVNNVKNKKVAFLIEIPTPYRDSFFEEFNQNRDLSFEVLYCASGEYGRDWKQEQKRYPYKILPGFSYPFIGSTIFVLKVNPRIWSQLSGGSYDAVIIGSYIQPTMLLAICWCLWHKVPYILWSESHHLTGKSILRRMLKWPLVKFAIKGAGAFLVMGSNSRDYLISYGADSAKIFFCPNTPDVKKMTEASSNYHKEIEGLRRELHIQGNPVIIYAGRLIRVKNVKTLFRAFRLVQYKIPKAGLVIVGGGPLRGSLENLAEKLKLNNVCFAGPVQPKDLVKYYASGDIFVLVSHDEPWGVVVLEAMACGLAVVVSDKVGCAKDLVEPNRSGFIVPAKSIKELSLAMAKLLDNTDLCRQTGSYAQEIARKWDYDFSILQLREALKIAANKGEY